MRHSIFSVAVLGLSLMSCGGCGSRESLAGRPFTTLDITPITPDAKPFTLDDLKGKVTLINFWATWCPPCIQEFPHLLRIVDGHRDQKDFQFLSVSTGHESVDAIRTETAEFLQTRGFRIPVYADVQGRTQTSLGGDASNAVPVTVLVDRDAKIAKVVVGFKSAELDEVQLQIETLLQAKK